MLDALDALIQKNKPFVAFKLPNAEEVQVYYQQDDQLHLTSDFSEAGFLMAPFHETGFYSYIPNTHTYRVPIPTEASIIGSNISVVDQNKKPFVGLVQKAINEFQNTALEKVVVSRVLSIGSESKNPAQTFQNLVQLYPAAFVYYWHHPSTGSWMGATPERFAHLNENKLHTIALAGTSPAIKDQSPDWSSKEIQEQQIVTDSIASSLKSMFPLVELDISAVASVQAGALWHLKTDIQATNTTITLPQVIKALHPTPAVGGVPKAQSVDFIIKNEGYDRKFYTGFLGPFDSESSANLFVNLRCAELTDLGYEVFVGAGIISGSDPEREWEETQRKAKTFCKAL